MASHNIERVGHFVDNFLLWRRTEMIKGYQLYCIDIVVISINIVANLLSSNISQLLIQTKSASLTRDMGKSIVPKLGSIPVPES